MTRPPGDDAFDIRTEPRADHLRLLVSGELDLFREADLRRALDDVLADTTPERLVLDVRGVQFLDSSGLRALLMCRDRARSLGVPLALAVAPGPVTRLLDVAGVRNWFAYD